MKTHTNMPSSANTKKPHVHAELIKAWADGAVIEVQRNLNGEGKIIWEEENPPQFHVWANYRIKPESKPDIVRYAHIKKPNKGAPVIWVSSEVLWDKEAGPAYTANVNAKLVFDGETQELKGVEFVQ